MTVVFIPWLVINKFGHLKTHEIATLFTTQAWELSFEATAALRKMRRRPSIITACSSQADLWPICHAIVRLSIRGSSRRLLQF